ncbi:MAG TPA: hypothetical protein VF657_10935, partial [Actinoplanes sp.]
MKIAVLAGASVLLATGVSALVNIATDAKGPRPIGALLALTVLFAGYEALRAKLNADELLAAERAAETIADDARKSVDTARNRLTVAVDDVISPLVEHIDRAKDPSLGALERRQHLSIATEQVCAGLRQLIKAEGRLRTTFYTLDAPMARSLSLWSATGRAGFMPEHIAEDDAPGPLLFRILDTGIVPQQAKDRKVLTKFTGGYPILAVRRIL